jgi:hypothetical protein
MPAGAPELPPGAAKSTYADVVFVPWFMAKYPRHNVILASYAANIARKQGRARPAADPSRPSPTCSRRAGSPPPRAPPTNGR